MAIEKQLVHQATVVTRNRKPLESVMPDFAYDPPLWELRVGEYRVFYDVSSESETVFIRAIRQKMPRQRTEDIL